MTLVAHPSPLAVPGVCTIMAASLLGANRRVNLDYLIPLRYVICPSLYALSCTFSEFSMLSRSYFLFIDFLI